MTCVTAEYALYRTTSLVCAPIRDHRGTVISAVQVRSWVARKQQDCIRECCTRALASLRMMLSQAINKRSGGPFSASDVGVLECVCSACRISRSHADVQVCRHDGGNCTREGKDGPRLGQSPAPYRMHARSQHFVVQQEAAKNVSNALLAVARAVRCALELLVR